MSGRGEFLQGGYHETGEFPQREHHAMIPLGILKAMLRAISVGAPQREEQRLERPHTTKSSISFGPSTLAHGQTCTTLS